jgi:hypothetical protein
MRHVPIVILMAAAAVVLVCQTSATISEEDPGIFFLNPQYLCQTLPQPTNELTFFFKNKLTKNSLSLSLSFLLSFNVVHMP